MQSTFLFVLINYWFQNKTSQISSLILIFFSTNANSSPAVTGLQWSSTLWLCLTMVWSTYDVKNKVLFTIVNGHQLLTLTIKPRNLVDSKLVIKLTIINTITLFQSRHRNSINTISWFNNDSTSADRKYEWICFSF